MYWILTFLRCANPIARGEVRISVDLDVENGRPSGKGDRIILCKIKQTTVIRMASLHAYLNKQIEFDNSVLCAISDSPEFEFNDSTNSHDRLP